MKPALPSAVPDKRQPPSRPAGKSAQEVFQPAKLQKDEPSVLAQNQPDRPAHFLNAEEVDQLAEPGVDFDALLEKIVPLDVKTLVLEFWINEDGETAEVKCIEGDCTDDILASLPELETLIFVPAKKNGSAVASRKIIRIDSKPVVDF